MPEVLGEGGRPEKLLTLAREAIRRRHTSGRTGRVWWAGSSATYTFTAGAMRPRWVSQRWKPLGAGSSPMPGA